jgi:hypothetical protein
LNDAPHQADRLSQIGQFLIVKLGSSGVIILVRHAGHANAYRCNRRGRLSLKRAGTRDRPADTAAKALESEDTRLKRILSDTKLDDETLGTAS